MTRNNQTIEVATVSEERCKRARAQIAQLQRMLGKKTMEAEILKEAVEFAREKKWIARSPLSGKDDQ